MRRSKIYSFTIPADLGDDFKIRCEAADVHASKIIQFLLLGIKNYSSDNLKIMQEYIKSYDFNNFSIGKIIFVLKKYFLSPFKFFNYI